MSRFNLNDKVKVSMDDINGRHVGKRGTVDRVNIAYLPKNWCRVKHDDGSSSVYPDHRLELIHPLLQLAEASE